MSSRYTKEKLSIIVRKNIKKYRLMRKYTLQELADLTGLTHGYVRDLECLTIDKTPLLETIGEFADALELSKYCSDDLQTIKAIMLEFRIMKYVKYDSETNMLLAGLSRYDEWDEEITEDLHRKQIIKKIRREIKYDRNHY